jgi:peroxin-12
MEFLSHLPSTSPSANPLHPTLFELIAQDQLRDLIQPTLRYLVVVGHFHDISDGSSMLNAIQDIFLDLRHGMMSYTQDLCFLLIDISSLHMVARLGMLLISGGSFTENFYGLKRERTISSPPLSRTVARAPNQVSQRTKLRNVDIYKSLFMLVTTPSCPVPNDRLESPI